MPIGCSARSQTLGMTGVVSPNQAVETGKMLGAERIIVGSVGKLGISIVLNARAVEVKTGRVVGGWSVTGSDVKELPGMAKELAARISGQPVASTRYSAAPQLASSAPARSVADTDSVTGCWVSEWYDGKGKHPGSICLAQSGNTFSGWTIESIGPARMSGKIENRSLTGIYTANYGKGEFEFTLSQDGGRLIGSYKASHAVHGTWMAWRRPRKIAAPTVGSTVLADWSGDIWTYPASIGRVEGGSYFVRYQDGDKELLSKSRVYAMDLRPGDIVFIAQEHQKNYRYATVLEVGNEQLQVEYKDGRRKWEPMRRMRMLLARKKGY